MKVLYDYVMKMSDRSKGILLCVVGVMAFTPDSILIRKVAHVPNNTVLFYRNLIFAFTMFIGLVITEKRNTFNKIKALGKWGTATGFIFGSSLWFLILGIQKTAAANVLVIQSSNPVFAAIFSWFILGESMSKLTLGTSAVCILAIILIFAGDVGSSSTDDANNASDNTAGLLFAVASSSTFGLYVVMLRWLSIYQT